MAIVSAFTIIRSLSLFHVMLGYFFLTNPRFILDQNIVFILGEAMQLGRHLSLAFQPTQSPTHPLPNPHFLDQTQLSSTH